MMKTIEDIAVPVPALVAERNETNNYAAVQYNALKHGILSKHVVLPHEDKDEFDDLLGALMAEHQPGGVTEIHLIEELAGVLWRKRRVLLAEGAKINRGLRGSLHGLDGISNSTVKNAVPADPALAGAFVDFRDLMSLTKEEMKTWEQEIVRNLKSTQKADRILHLNRANAYTRALKVLPLLTRNLWSDRLDEEEAEATAESLRKFICFDVLPGYNSNLAEVRHHDAIKRQVIGEGIDVPVMESLSRYETHLDRKFERTLAMLIKLKELRGRK